MAIHALPCAGGRQHVAVNSRPRSLAPALAPRPQAQPLPPHRCRRLQTVPQEQPLPSHRCRRLQVYARRSSGRGGSGGPRRQEPVPIDRLVQQYALPALGLLVVGSLVAPVLGGLIFAATGVGIMIAAGAAALSLSWVVVPLAVAVFGMPALMAGGLAAGRIPQLPASVCVWCVCVCVWRATLESYLGKKFSSTLHCAPSLVSPRPPCLHCRRICDRCCRRAVAAVDPAGARRRRLVAGRFFGSTALLPRRQRGGGRHHRRGGAHHRRRLAG